MDELQEPGVIIQFGVPPNQIDLLNQIDGVEFSEAWRTRVTVTLKTPGNEVELHYVGLGLLIDNKQQAARPKDLEDLEFLKQLRPPG